MIALSTRASTPPAPASGARPADGRPTRTTVGLVAAATDGIRSIRVECARRVSISGLQPSASRAAAGRPIPLASAGQDAGLNLSGASNCTVADFDRNVQFASGPDHFYTIIIDKRNISNHPCIFDGPMYGPSFVPDRVSGDRPFALCFAHGLFSGMSPAIGNLVSIWTPVQTAGGREPENTDLSFTDHEGQPRNTRNFGMPSRDRRELLHHEGCCRLCGRVANFNR
jgi:hypothetical protein